MGPQRDQYGMRAHVLGPGTMGNKRALSATLAPRSLPPPAPSWRGRQSKRELRAPTVPGCQLD